MIDCLRAREGGVPQSSVCSRLDAAYFVERFSLVHKMKGHLGCVNSVLFSETGQYALTGSDDTYVNIYDVDSGEMLQRIPTIHDNNIFFAKDVSGSNCSKIITCAADGQVVLMLNNGDGRRQSKILHEHNGRAHRIALIPGAPDQFYSCGEDGVCCFFDIRERSGTAVTAGDSDDNSSSSPLGMGLPRARSASLMCTSFLLSGRSPSIYSCNVNPMRPHEVSLITIAFINGIT
jgi:WD repeat-containing protein 42A